MACAQSPLLRKMAVSGKTDPVEIGAPSGKGSMWVTAPAPLPPPFHLHLLLLPINRAEEGALYRGTVRQACWDTDWWQAVAERNVVNGQQIQLGSSRPRPTPAQLPDSTQILQLRHDVEISEKEKIVPSIVTSRLVTPRSNLSNPVPSLRACSACSSLETVVTATD